MRQMSGNADPGRASTARRGQRSPAQWHNSTEAVQWESLEVGAESRAELKQAIISSQVFAPT
jgi:hypothetical protein